MVRVKSRGAIVHQETKTFPSERLAWSWAEELEARIKQTGVPTRKLQTLSVGDVIDKYAEHLSGLRPLRRSLDHELAFLAQTFRSDKLYGLTSEPFVRFALERRKNGAGPATIMHNLTLVRSALNLAKSLLNIDADPTPVVEALKGLGRTGVVAKSVAVEVRVPQDKIDTLVQEFLRIAGNPATIIPMHRIVPLAVAFPRRRTELCSMLWENWDPVARTMRLLDTKHPTKVRNELVPVPPDAAAIIESLPRIDARVLPYNPESVSASFERACERLGILGVRFHDLRHEGISRLFEKGLQIQEVALISGHTSWATLKRYTHIKPADVLEKLSRREK